MKGGMYKTGKTACTKVQGMRKKTLLRNCRGLVQFSLAELRVLAGGCWPKIEQPAHKGLAY